MVSLSKTRDKFVQQRQGRTNGAIRSTADRRPMGEDPSLTSETAPASAWRQTTRQRSQGARRDSVDSAQRGSLAGFARGISFTGNVLAATSGLGRARDLAHHLARISGGTEPTRATRLERIVSGRQFCSSEKGGSEVGKTKRGKGTKWMVVVDGRGVPLGNSLHSASPSEMRLAEQTLATIRVGRRHHAGRPRQKPLRVIADKGYDCDAPRKRLRRRGIVLIAPLRLNRRRTPPQDGRILRRYKRRWIVERTFAWLGNFRHLVVRYDRSLTIYRAFFHIACFMIVLRRVVQ